VKLNHDRFRIDKALGNFRKNDKNKSKNKNNVCSVWGPFGDTLRVQKLSSPHITYKASANTSADAHGIFRRGAPRGNIDGIVELLLSGVFFHPHTSDVDEHGSPISRRRDHREHSPGVRPPTHRQTRSILSARNELHGCSLRGFGREFHAVQAEVYGLSVLPSVKNPMVLPHRRVSRHSQDLQPMTYRCGVPSFRDGSATRWIIGVLRPHLFLALSVAISK